MERGQERGCDGRRLKKMEDKEEEGKVVWELKRSDNRRRRRK